MPTKPPAATSNFKQIFYGVLALTVCLLIACVLLDTLGPDKDYIHTRANEFSRLGGVGFGAIVGLLGGKSIK